MTYVDLINAFERWLETNYLPSSAQLLWYKLIALFNKAGWSEWITVDNYRLMSIMQIESEKTLIRCRDKLIDNNFFEYKKGKKRAPNQYKINTVNFTGKMTVNMTVQKGVKMTANVSNINRIRQDKEKEKENSKRKTFTLPTLEEVQEYIEEKRLNVDANYFYNYFSEGNWIDSKGNSVKNWKQKLITWSNHNRIQVNNFENKKSDLNEIIKRMEKEENEKE